MVNAAPRSGDEIPEATRAVLPYEHSLPRGRRLARFFGWTMLILAVLAILVAACCILNPMISVNEYQQYLGGGVIGTPAGPLAQLPPDGIGNWQDKEVSAIRRSYLPEALLYLSMFLLTQWMFLCPRGSWRIRSSQEEPPGRRAAAAAGSSACCSVLA